MILEVDAGNSRIKWRVLQRQPATGQQLLCHGTAATLAEMASALGENLELDLARACSVRADSTLDDLSSWVEQKWNLRLQVAKVSPSCGGVSNSYADVTRMGIDRWLAMLAAYGKAHGACVVVDAGTALTVDLVSPQGQHRGGYILPGLNLMADALEQNTGIRLKSREFGATTAPGTSTEQAVLQGALASEVALIRESVESLRSRGDKVTIFLSGGDGGLIAAALEMHGESEFKIDPELVLDGLAIACPG